MAEARSLFGAGLDFLRRAVSYWRIYGTKEFLRLARSYLLNQFAPIESDPEAGREILDSDRVNPKATPAGAVFGEPFVLIIGELSLPQCRKYRVVQKTEILNHMQVRNEYSSWQDVSRNADFLQFATAVIFYRVPHGDLFKSYLDECRRLGIITIYDIDDPVFSRSVYLENKNLLHLKRGEQASLLDGCSRFLDAMRQSDILVGSTPTICALIARETGRKAHLWRNLLDSETLQAAKLALGSSKQSSETVTLGYASGSRAHEADFRVIVPVLVKLMRARPELRLRVLGYLQLPSELSSFSDRIARHDFTNYFEYVSCLSEVDVNLIPLLADEFNDSKSAIRYLEASAVCIPSVATAIGDFKNIIESGKNGFLATDMEDWYSTIMKLCDDARIRRTIGEAANDKVMSDFTISETGFLDHIEPSVVMAIRGRT